MHVLCIIRTTGPCETNQNLTQRIETIHSPVPQEEPTNGKSGACKCSVDTGRLLKSRNYCQYNTVNKTPFSCRRPSLLSGRSNLSAVPMSVLLLFLPLFSGQQECHIRCLALFSTSSNRPESKRKATADKIIQSQVYFHLHIDSVIPFHAILYRNNATFLKGLILISDKRPTSIKWPLAISPRVVA